MAKKNMGLLPPEEYDDAADDLEIDDLESDFEDLELSEEDDEGPYEEEDGPSQEFLTFAEQAIGTTDEARLEALYNAIKACK